MRGRLRVSRVFVELVNVREVHVTYHDEARCVAIVFTRGTEPLVRPSFTCGSGQLKDASCGGTTP